MREGVSRNCTGGHVIKGRKYRISANSFRGNYSFLNLTLCTVTFGLQYIQVRKLFKGGNYSRAETIHGNTVCKISMSLSRGEGVKIR